MTIICDHCQSEVPHNQTHCPSCGASLNVMQDVQVVPSNDEDECMNQRPKYDNKLDQTNMLDETAYQEPETTAEEVADDDITHATTKMPNMNDEDGLLHIGSVRFRGNLVLKDKDRDTIYRVENDQLDEAIIGRLNIQTGFRPHVDFTDGDGKERGVSRRHATINQRGDLIFVTDHNSLNGTYLNGQRLVPEQSRVMRDSDSLRIGHISLIVIFEEA